MFQICKVKHAGEIVKSVVRDRGISISELARRLGRTRPFIYALFEKDSINTAVLQQLRQVLNYPFTELLGRQDPIKDYGGGFLSEAEFDSLQESLTRAEAEAEHWRKKYYELVEQFNAHLLKDKKKG